MSHGRFASRGQSLRRERHDGLLTGLQVLELDHAVRISGFQEPCGLKRDVLAVAIERAILTATSLGGLPAARDLAG